MDSIGWEKPIIAFKLRMFENLQKKYYNIGYICDKKNIKDILYEIIRKYDPTAYQQQVINMHSLKFFRTPEKLAEKYMEFFD